MKKILLIVGAVTVSLSASAQFYVGVNAGYGFGSPKEVLGTNTNMSSGTEENIYGSLGGGLNFGVTPGFWFGDHIGAELGINYFLGSKIEVDKTTTPFGEYTATAHSNQFRLLPSLVIKSGGEKLSLYGKLGLVIPASGKTIREVEDTGTGGPGSVLSVESETVGKVSLGYTGAIGFNLGVGEKVDFFAEVSSVNLRISSDKTTVTKYSANGTDVLNDLPTYFKEINYVDELNDNSNTGAGANPDQAQDQLRINSNYSGIFLNVGLRFTF